MANLEVVAVRAEAIQVALWADAVGAQMAAPTVGLAA